VASQPRCNDIFLFQMEYPNNDGVQLIVGSGLVFRWPTEYNAIEGLVRALPAFIRGERLAPAF